MAAMEFNLGEVWGMEPRWNGYPFSDFRFENIFISIVGLPIAEGIYAGYGGYDSHEVTFPFQIPAESDAYNSDIACS